MKPKAGLNTKVDLKDEGLRADYYSNATGRSQRPLPQTDSLLQLRDKTKCGVCSSTLFAAVHPRPHTAA